MSLDLDTKVPFTGWASIVSDDLENNLNFLWRLHLPSLTWTRLFPKGAPPFPCDKAACWVHNNRYMLLINCHISNFFEYFFCED